MKMPKNDPVYTGLLFGIFCVLHTARNPNPVWHEGVEAWRFLWMLHTKTAPIARCRAGLACVAYRPPSLKLLWFILLLAHTQLFQHGVKAFRRGL